MTAHIIKLGGSTLEQAGPDAPLWPAIARAHADAHQNGGGVVLVHGGGAAVDERLAQLGRASDKLDGLRVTPESDMPIVAEVIAGLVNNTIVQRLAAAGASPVGLTLADGDTAILEFHSGPNSPLGRVGKVVDGNPDFLTDILDAGHLPVIACVGLGPDHDWLNVNADDAALGIASILDADQLTLLTDVDAVLDHNGDPIPDLTDRDATALIEAGVIVSGMAVKVQAALAASKAINAPVTITSWKALADHPATSLGTTINATAPV